MESKGTWQGPPSDMQQICMVNEQKSRNAHNSQSTPRVVVRGDVVPAASQFWKRPNETNSRLQGEARKSDHAVTLEIVLFPTP